MADQKAAYIGNEQAVQQAPCYGYIIEHRNDGTRSFLTGWEKPISIRNLPARFAAANPQTFTAAQINHGESQTSGAWEKRSVSINIGTTDERLRRFFVTAAAVKIAVYILRINTNAVLQDGEVDYDSSVMIFNSGLMGSIAFKDQIITTTITPEPQLSDQAVPRYYFQRTCNHVFGSAACGVTKPAHTFTVEALNRQARQVTLSGPPPVAPDYFEGGTMLRSLTGEIMALLGCDAGGTLGHARVTTRAWNPSLQPGETVVLQPGCKHTTEHCLTRFNNLANFGGFPYIPNRNPVLHGVL